MRQSLRGPPIDKQLPLDAPAALMRFTRPAVVQKQPWLVLLTLAFVAALLTAALWPGDEPAAPQPVPAWAWGVWLVLLAVAAFGVFLLCHAEEVVVDAASQRVTQVHRFLNHELQTTVWALADFTAVAVSLKFDRHTTGSSSPGTGATLASARTVHTRRCVLSLERPDRALAVDGRSISTPTPALECPLPAAGDVHAAEATARALAALGGWPAFRRDYTLQSVAGADAVKLVAGTSEPIP